MREHEIRINRGRLDWLEIGYVDKDGKWQAVDRVSDKREARRRCAYLNSHKALMKVTRLKKNRISNKGY
jgi:superfamily I DNA and RNA helicase